MKWINKLAKATTVLVIVLLIINTNSLQSMVLGPLGHLCEKIREFGQLRMGIREDGEPQKPEPAQPYQDGREKPEQGPPSHIERGDGAKDPAEDKSGTDTDKQEYFLTLNEIKAIEDINLEDKLKGLAIISKLGAKDMERVMEMTGGGITETEFQELKGILEKSLTEKDMECLNEILVKNKTDYEKREAIR